MNSPRCAAPLFCIAVALSLRPLAAQCATTWQALGQGLNNMIVDLAVNSGGDIFAGGAFTTCNGIVCNHVAGMIGGTTWAPLGSGMNDQVLAMCVLPNGDVVAGGKFTTAGGVAANRIALWNGSVWAPLGSGAPLGEVDDLAVAPNGDLIACGSFTSMGGVSASNIARWNGSSWSTLGLGITGFAPLVKQVVALPNGDVIAAGAFFSAGGAPATNIARWNGSSWSAMGTTRARVDALTVGVDGTIYAADGDLGMRVASWTGSTWLQLGPLFNLFATGGGSPATALHPLPDGGILVAGFFTLSGSTPIQGIARWDGSQWSPVDGGFSPLVSQQLNTFANAPDGSVYAGGAISSIGSVTVNHLAHLVTNCPATAVSVGSGCAGSAGPVTLVADTLPWMNSNLSLTATGFGPNSVAAWSTGFPQSIPLSTLHPAATPGCLLLSTTAVDFGIQVPIGGVSVSTVHIPSVPQFLGVTFRKQVGSVDLAPNLDIVGLTSSNAMALTLGVF